MSYSITKETAENGLEYLALVYEGEFTKEIFKTNAEQVMETILNLQCDRLLYGFQNAVFKLSTFDVIEIHKFEEAMLVKHGISLTKFRRAILINQELNFFSDLFFLRVISPNRGQNTKRFTNIDEAIIWLTQN